MSKTKYDIDPEFKLLTFIHPPIDKVTIPWIQKIMRLQYHTERTDRYVRVKRVNISSEDGNNVRCLLYMPRRKKTSACLLYCHGGGYTFPASPNQYKLARIYARKVGCYVLFPDYRLAPSYPFPAAPNDCFAAYKWLLRHKVRKIAVCGESAGGTLAMAVTLRAIDENIRIPCAQMLIYPAAGNCGETGSIRLYRDTPMCNSKDMDKYGKWYVQDENAGKLAYRSPVEADSFDGIPSSYIETAEYDCLRDGAIIYAGKLSDNGIDVELHQTKGTLHGYDTLLNGSIVKDLIIRRIEFLKKSFLQ